MRMLADLCSRYPLSVRCIKADCSRDLLYNRQRRLLSTNLRNRDRAKQCNPPNHSLEFIRFIAELCTGSHRLSRYDLQTYVSEL